MSDRVEERREEARVLEQRLEKMRAEDKRQAATLDFRKVVAAAQKARGQQAQQDTTKQGTRQRAAARILVRAGITANQSTHEMYAEGDARMLRQRDDEQHKGEELSARAQTRERAKQGESLNTPVMPRGNAQGEPKDKDTSKDETNHQGRETRREVVVSGAGAQGGLLSTAGVGPRSASGPLGPSTPTAAQIIDQIVRSVRKGVDERGLGLIEIDLIDDVLAGASLRIQAERDGISLQMLTGDEDVSRLLSSGATAHELTQALRQKGITLRSLEVNDHKVVR